MTISKVPEAFPAVILVPWGILFLLGLISAIFRASRGKPIRPKVPAEAKFAERIASGYSVRSWLSRLAGARNCLCVWVDGDSLNVCPQFPFTLLFFPEIYGLEYRIPLERIVMVSKQRFMFCDTIRVEFRNDMGEKVGVELRLRHPLQFIGALNMPERVQGFAV